eukprot:289175-Prymnesium_polylepis.1
MAISCSCTCFCACHRSAAQVRAEQRWALCRRAGRVDAAEQDRGSDTRGRTPRAARAGEVRLASGRAECGRRDQAAARRLGGEVDFGDGGGSAAAGGAPVLILEFGHHRDKTKEQSMSS